MSIIHYTQDVFTPTTPARLTFVERSKINDNLVIALRTPGKQIVVYGYSGSGKTTLLENKLHQTYEAHITSRCMTGMTFEQLVLDAFDQLGVFYNAEATYSKSQNTSSSLQAEYAGIKSQIGSTFKTKSSQKSFRVLPPQLTPQTLAQFMGEAGCCWVLEDFHKMETDEKEKLAQVMKVFMDMADAFRNLKIIAIGAVNSARQIVESDSEMKNRVAEIRVPLMSDSETHKIIEKGQGLLNFTLDTEVRDGIVHYANGLAAVCHQLCLNICYTAGIYETCQETVEIGDVTLRSALEVYLDEASDTLKASFDKALRKKRSGKFDNGRLILEALSRSDQHGATYGDLYTNIRKRRPDYPSGNLTYFLKELQKEDRGAIVRHDPSSNKYSFSDPIYRAYAITLFDHRNQSERNVCEDREGGEDYELSRLYEVMERIINQSKESPE